MRFAHATFRTSRHAALCLLLSAAAAWAPSPAQATPSTPAADTLKRAERERIVRETGELIRTSFAHWEGIPGDRFELRFAHWRNRALATPSRRAFSLDMRRFMAALKNGHSTFADSWMLAADPAPLPFSLAFREGSWVVTESVTPGLTPGDIVTRVDGEPVSVLYDSIAPLLCASSERARRMQFTLRGFLWPHEFMVETASGASFRIVRTVRARPAPAERVVTARWIVADSIAYVSVPSFGEPSFEAAALEQVRGPLRGARVLLVDVRGNGGGNTPRALVHALLGGRPFVWWKEDPDKVPGGWFDRMGAAFRRSSVSGPTFGGRVVLLTDAECGSACEDFVMPLVWSGAAVAVGDTTYGSTGQPVFRDFGNGITISVSAKRAHFPDGSAFEGVGIAPDVLVSPLRADAGAARDRTLEAALRVARTGIPMPRFAGR